MHLPRRWRRAQAFRFGLALLPGSALPAGGATRWTDALHHGISVKTKPWGPVMRAIFVMVKCEMGQAYQVAREMADSISELSEMHSVSGQYDLLGKFYLEPDQDIGLFVVEKVQSVRGVKDTYTLQTFNAFSGGRG